MKNQDQSKIAPMPAETTMAFLKTKGDSTKAENYQLQTSKSLTTRELKDNYPDVVANDVILDDGKIYGLPLSIDTLVLFYNKDLFNNAGISQAPKYWNAEFFQDVKKLTKQDAKKGIIQIGRAHV
jgi:ABC-type glycerol-3-phosphate transport system substrate-binding protein